ncbi:MAG: hypothetical protein HOB63_11095 [Opitutae bacterium]|nr:hypothetical protein [Opitutae bacterium]
MKTIFKTLLGLCMCLSFTGCIEFENQEIAYHHDQEKDEIRMTLRYEGIFGNLKGGQNMQKNPDDRATAEKLNLLQIEQLASVLNEKQAFFFSNWIFEYKRATLKQMLKKEPESSLAFGKPEKDLIEALLKNVKIENVGFYKDQDGRLCGAQTLRLSNASKVISLANRVLGRQLKARIPEMREERNKKVPNSFTAETIDLIEKKTQADFSFIQVEGNLVTVTLIMTEPDQQRISKSTLTDLPQGTRIEFQDEALLVKIGGKQDGKGRLWKDCFEGYLPNALNHIRENHKKLLLKPKKANQRLQNFLTGEE